MPKIENKVSLPDEIVMNKIYIIRGVKVMLDADLAELYGVGTKVLNQSVKRNLKRFPDDFMFQLTQEEWAIMRSQFVTASQNKRNINVTPYSFTEQGVAMLSGILNSDRAINVNIQIMRIFTNMRKLLADNSNTKVEIEILKKKVHNNSQNIELVFQYLDELIEKKGSPKPRNRIGFKQYD